MFAHIDADAFFASVLQRKYPRLKGKSLLALGMGGGGVIAASYEAKAKGVKTGMRLKDALALAPGAVHLPSDFTETALASHQIESILEHQGPTLEQMSIDEWFLDLRSLVGGIPFDLLLWAKDIQQEILHDTGLSVSVGIAPTKLLAKMASEYRKPAGLTVIEKRDIETFLSNRPAPAISGIGRKRSLQTKANRWETAWDIATADPEVFTRLFGKPGRDMQRELQGESISPVAKDTRPQQSISRCRSFRATKDEKHLWAQLLQHLSYCTLKMRTQGSACRGISVWLRAGYDHHAGGTCKLPQPSDTEDVLIPFVRRCFQEAFERHTAYTQVGLALWNLAPKGATQF